MNQQILVPLDGSALAEVVMPHAAALARASSAGVDAVASDCSERAT